MHFSGVYTAIVTPLLNGKVDYSSLQRLVEFQISGGVTGLVVVGTTGESPTLNSEEHLDVVRRTIAIAAGRVQVFAGTGSNSTEEAVYYTQSAVEAGADGVLQVAPYYNKPTQEGLFHHFSAVAAVCDKPIMLYSIPGRCIIEIGIETCARLREAFPQIKIMKEAGGSCDRVGNLVNRMGEDYWVLSGDDSLTVPFMSAGACGVVSVASNLYPAEITDMVQQVRNNNVHGATHLHLQMLPFFHGIFKEPNPVPIKYLMKRHGLISSDEVRLPLSALAEDTRSQMDQLFSQMPAPSGLENV